MSFLEQKYKLNKNEAESNMIIENGKSPSRILRTEPCVSAHIRITNENENFDDLELANEKRVRFL